MNSKMAFTIVTILSAYLSTLNMATSWLWMKLGKSCFSCTIYLWLSAQGFSVARMGGLFWPMHKDESTMKLIVHRSKFDKLGVHSWILPYSASQEHGSNKNCVQLIRCSLAGLNFSCSRYWTSQITNPFLHHPVLSISRTHTNTWNHNICKDFSVEQGFSFLKH